MDKHEELKMIDILRSDSYTDITSPRHYYYVKKTFKLVTLDLITKVARISDGRLMATNDNVQMIIRNIHTACGHKGEKITYKKIAEQYANITMAVVKKFIAECERCAEKSRKTTPKEIVVRPITLSEFNQRSQVDIIDFQNVPDGNYKFILRYQEYLTKFSILRPLTSKKATEVAEEVFKIFLDFGAPQILQSDNGREFTGEIIKILGSLWPNLLLVNGIPRLLPNHQDSVEHSNSTLTNSLNAWMKDQKTSAWSLGLRIIQWEMNTTYHKAVKIDPYNAMFGHKAKMSLPSSIPQELLTKIHNGIYEEDMQNLLEPEQKIREQEQSNCTNITLECDPSLWQDDLNK